MDLSSWFTNQLNSGAEGFIWAVEQVPPERRLLAPPQLLGEWNVARQVFHMLYYEQNVVVPSMVAEPCGEQWMSFENKHAFVFYSFQRTADV